MSAFENSGTAILYHHGRMGTHIIYAAYSKKLQNIWPFHAKTRQIKPIENIMVSDQDKMAHISQTTWI